MKLGGCASSCGSTAGSRASRVPRPGRDALQKVSLDIPDRAGKPGKLVLVDDSSTGRLAADDVCPWP